MASENVSSADNQQERPKKEGFIKEFLGIGQSRKSWTKAILGLAMIVLTYLILKILIDVFNIRGLSAGLLSILTMVGIFYYVTKVYWKS